MTPRVFALSDTHLSAPMDFYDAAWAGHMDKVERGWREAVSAQDIVLIGGDISSARRLRDAVPDLR